MHFIHLIWFDLICSLKNTNNWSGLNVWCFRRFHYAARIWDAVKKSSALSEYSRLLCWSFGWSAVAQRSVSSWERKPRRSSCDVVIRTQRALQKEVGTTVSHLKLQSWATFFLAGEARRLAVLKTACQEVASPRCQEAMARLWWWRVYCGFQWKHLKFFFSFPLLQI